MIYAHHGYGEELLPLLGSGGAVVASSMALIARAKLARMVRWLRRR